ncbi:hypothetical protein B0J12DRAFT_259608 [Macrophomina phaseolina]|uniref:Uncharacterized protein n=1 Tax=Macrophomina phaseolina TaxID=35725 RepID=A0ABQ8FYX1_9PEZI|nr:hypothetical protein B0J12DRAFT_259608 [Macrophomina phaseolina]
MTRHRARPATRLRRATGQRAHGRTAPPLTERRGWVRGGQTSASGAGFPAGRRPRLLLLPARAWAFPSIAATDALRSRPPAHRLRCPACSHAPAPPPLPLCPSLPPHLRCRPRPLCHPRLLLPLPESPLLPLRRPAYAPPAGAQTRRRSTSARMRSTASSSRFCSSWPGKPPSSTCIHFYETPSLSLPRGIRGHRQAGRVLACSCCFLSSQAPGCLVLYIPCPHEGITSRSLQSTAACSFDKTKKEN